MSVVVEYADRDPNGLAVMLGGLIEANLAQHPSRESLLRPTVVGITAPDAGVSVTIRMRPGRVRIWNGLPPPGRQFLHVRADSTELIGLSAVPLRFGMPDARTNEGRDATRKLLRGDIKVRGMFRNVGALARLNRLLSVASEPGPADAIPALPAPRPAPPEPPEPEPPVASEPPDRAGPGLADRADPEPALDDELAPTQALVLREPPPAPEVEPFPPADAEPAVVQEEPPTERVPVVSSETTERTAGYGPLDEGPPRPVVRPFAILGALAVVASAFLPWLRLRFGFTGFDIPARYLFTGGGGGGGLSAGVLLVVLGVLALALSFLPAASILRRLLGLASAAVPVIYAVQLLSGDQTVGQLASHFGPGEYAAFVGGLLVVFG